jgi:CheY-like chemotaxis protein
MNGQELLAEIKKDAGLRIIPVVILTSSRAEEDVVESYSLHAKRLPSEACGFQGN